MFGKLSSNFMLYFYKIKTLGKVDINVYSNSLFSELCSLNYAPVFCIAKFALN